MTDQTPLEQMSDDNGRGWKFWGIAGTLATIVACIILFAIAAAIGLANESTSAMADFVAIARDMLIILLTLQAIVIAVAVIVVIIQVSALLNVFQNEIDPIVSGAQETVDVMKGTAEFVSKHVTEPVIKTTGYVTTAREFVKEASGVKDMVDSVTDSESVEDEAHDL
jgi:hypothetical protein